MSKIICEICGTSYPETNMQCPICGCVKPVDANAVVNKETEAGSTYAYVKGGRFSKKNVKKRNSGSAMPVEQSVKSDVDDKEARTNRALVITIAALLLAVIAVGIYVAIYFFGDAQLPNTGSTENTQAETTAGETTDTLAEETQDTALYIPCTAITVTPDTVKLESVGQNRQLEVTLTPVDTTDTVTYVSDDPTIVTVNDTGLLTAVSEGKTTITITCGSIQTSCEVECKFTEGTTDKNQTEFKLNRSDFTLSHKGESWLLYTGKIPVAEVVWSSDNELVATISNGKVVAVGGGTTTVRAEYDGKEYTCTVRCNFNDNLKEDIYENEFKLNREDFTLFFKGDNWTLYNGDIPKTEISWRSDNTSVATVENGKVVAVGEGYTYIHAEYNGIERTCLVIVSFS